ncbi:prickle planar cell polarity protein 3 [Exaiptasia diaphana]|uniref:PET domain-containing protein n=1 Tax=Exaiptasia diaphana TaxID=2652724 RepID=A0A913WR95_EXADI|nr:prickle planar cell polarity protein 3 [Exaiptasia diaphana]
MTIYHDDGQFDEFPDVTSIENDAVSSLPGPPVFVETRSSSKKYLWSPPGLNSSQIDAYFREIPQEKVPIPGSPGMKYYDDQLTYQNPPQDRPQLAKLPPEHREPIAQFWKNEERKRGTGVVKVPFGSKQVS